MSFEFLRIKYSPNNISDDRIAVILISKNTPERVNRIIKFLGNRNQEVPMDLILIENGTNMFPPSQHTVIKLDHELDETIVFRMGVNYAHELEKSERFRYYSYMFISNNTEIPLQLEDISVLKSLQDILRENKYAVAVQPVLTVDSLTDFPHLVYPFIKEINFSRGKKLEISDSRQLLKVTNNPRRTNIIGHDCVMYRSTWFNEVGGFPKELPSGVGVNVYMSYIARLQGKELYMHPGFLVRCLSDISIRIGRSLKNKNKVQSLTMNNNHNSVDQGQIMVGLEESRRHKVVGFNDFAVYMRGRFGKDIMDKLGDNAAVEDEKSPGYYNYPLIEQFIGTMVTFDVEEGGHRLLMDHLYQNHQSNYALKRRGFPIVLAEVGATGVNFPHMNSTKKLEMLCRVYGYQFLSIDVDNNVTSRNNKATQDTNVMYDGFYLNGFRCHHVNSAGEKFLQGRSEENDNNYNLSPPQLIHYLYLDPVDVIGELKSPTAIEQCRQTNTKIIKISEHLIPKGGLICLNYTNPEVHQLLTTQLNYRQLHPPNSRNSSLYIHQS